MLSSGTTKATVSPEGVSTVLAYHLQYALVADFVIHSGSGVDSLSLLHAKCQGGQAFGKSTRVTAGQGQALRPPA